MDLCRIRKLLYTVAYCILHCVLYVVYCILHCVLYVVYCISCCILYTALYNYQLFIWSTHDFTNMVRYWLNEVRYWLNEVMDLCQSISDQVHIVLCRPNKKSITALTNGQEFYSFRNNFYVFNK